MADHSELLTKLLDAVVKDPSSIIFKDIANLSVDELEIYMEFTKEQKSDVDSEFAKHSAKQGPTTDPFIDIKDGEIEK